MTLPASGTITMGMVKAELGISGVLNLTDYRVRALFGIPTGTIKLTDGYGKSNSRRPNTYSWSGTTLFSSHTNDTLAFDVVSGYETSVNPTGTPATFTAAARPKTSPGLSTSTTIYSGFPPITYSGTLSICLSSSTFTSDSINLSNTVVSSVSIYYSTNSGGTYTFLSAAIGGSDFTTAGYITAFLSGVNLANLRVQIEAVGESAGSTIDSWAGAGATANVYDIIVL
jgi:hypothetical protein